MDARSSTLRDLVPATPFKVTALIQRSGRVPIGTKYFEPVPCDGPQEQPRAWGSCLRYFLHLAQLPGKPRCLLESGRVYFSNGHRKVSVAHRTAADLHMWAQAVG